MKFITTKEKLDFLAELIEKENTGNPDDLSERICVSLRTLYRYLDCLKDMGYRFSFCSRRKTYYMIAKDIKPAE